MTLAQWVHTICFQWWKQRVRCPKCFQTSRIQYSRSDISFSAFVRLERSKTPLCIELCGKQYFRVYFRSLLCGRKANLDCLKWSVLDYSCRPNIKDISLFQKQLTIPKYLDSVYQNNRFRSVFKSFNPFRSPQDNAFAIRRTEWVILGTLYVSYVHFILYLLSLNSLAS